MPCELEPGGAGISRSVERVLASSSKFPRTTARGDTLAREAGHPKIAAGVAFGICSVGSSVGCGTRDAVRIRRGMPRDCFGQAKEA